MTARRGCTRLPSSSVTTVIQALLRTLGAVGEGFRWFFLLHGQIGSPAPLARPLFTAALNAGEDVNQALGEVLRVLLSADHFGGFQHSVWRDVSAWVPACRLNSSRCPSFSPCILCLATSGRVPSRPETSSHPALREPRRRVFSLELDYSLDSPLPAEAPRESNPAQRFKPTPGLEPGPLHYEGKTSRGRASTGGHARACSSL
jgi:hypothetical protein